MVCTLDSCGFRHSVVSVIPAISALNSLFVAVWVVFVVFVVFVISVVFVNPKGPKIEKFQDRSPGLKFSSEIENLGRRPPTPIFSWAILKVKIESVQRDWSFQATQTIGLANHTCRNTRNNVYAIVAPLQRAPKKGNLNFSLENQEGDYRGSIQEIPTPSSLSFFVFFGVFVYLV